VGTPPVFFDERHAWDAQLRGEKVHIEGASFRGQPVWFFAEAPGPAPVSARPSWLPVSALGVFCIVGLGLAYRNLRLGRADREGARRIALLGALWYGGGNVLQEPRWVEWRLVHAGLGILLMFTVAGWSAYLALEPLVRRRWPDTLISWTRLLKGRPLDPLVGRHLLLGVLGGVAFTLLGQTSTFLTGPSRWPAAPWLLNGGWTAFGATIVDCGNGFLGSLLFLMLLALARQLLRNTALAVAVAIAVHLPASGSLSDPTAAAIEVVSMGLFAGLILRLGLLACVAANAVALFLGDVLMTTHLRAWYADSAVCGILATLAVAAWGFKAAVGGRPFFGDSRREAA
jgi:serine/threonine-protein kinase